MSLNLTASWLEAKQAPTMLLFANTVAASTTPLAGPGGIAANGFPMPLGGLAVKLYVWDQTSVQSASGSVVIAAGDLVSLNATYSGGKFTVELIVNGGTTGLTVANCLPNTTLQATLLLQQKE
ncbi:MAG: hypothetical protein P9L92_18755 [Candidatus Electryonea clarkiae]|nr:hypothetical protein [Candidatus Electryonea clarkiae]MDP8287840.1 hypothetical protein [Candidatus Electryonea clarkiae]